MMNAVPIAVFAFNRPALLARTLAALAANELASASPLTIFCDGPRHEGEAAATQAVPGSMDCPARALAISAGCAVVFLACGISVFRRTERSFADVI